MLFVRNKTTTTKLLRILFCSSFAHFRCFLTYLKSKQINKFFLNKLNFNFQGGGALKKQQKNQKLHDFEILKQNQKKIN